MPNREQINQSINQWSWKKWLEKNQRNKRDCEIIQTLKELTPFNTRKSSAAASAKQVNNVNWFSLAAAPSTGRAAIYMPRNKTSKLQKQNKKKYSLGGWRTDADPNCRREGGTEQQRFCCFHGHFSAWPHCETTLKPLQWGSFLFSFQIFPSKVMTTHIVPHICSSLINWLLRDDSLHTFFFFHFSTLFIVHQSTDLGDRFCIWQRRCGWG